MSNAFSFDTDFSAEQVQTAEAGNNYQHLPDGEYEFRCVKAEKGTFQPSGATGSKITEPCPMMTVRIEAQSDDGTLANAWNERLILHTSTSGIIFQFFTCAGLRKPGDTGRLPWDRIVGSRGRCRVSTRKGSNGVDYNQVKKWLAPRTDNDVPADW